MVEIPPHPSGGTFIAKQQIEQRSQHRQRADQQQPEDFIGGISGLVDDIKFYKHTANNQSLINPRGVFGQLKKQNQKPNQLQQNQKSSQNNPTRHHF